ncbi:DUF4266 domain-containing protein [Zhongshania sp.]|uniref:DUF4266 domain-containing protein n=1 Tax=Zhongshania sp. TaxID=1971902 RepID=UPI003565B713
MKLLIPLLAVLLLPACATAPLDAWDRGYLARPEMAWDPDSLSASQRSHVYFSKEASSGGVSAGGGGCGCN